MDKEDSYNYPEQEQDADNLLSSLLNCAGQRQQLQNQCDETHLKVEELRCQEQADQEDISSMYRDILNKQQSNKLLPENLYQEHGEQSILIITPQSKKTLPEPLIAFKKDYRLDKLTYQEESREAKIQRYLSKKPRRIWGRKVSYDCRKLVADKRERVNGRFVKKSPLISENSNNLHHSNADIFQMLQSYHTGQSHKCSNGGFSLE